MMCRRGKRSSGDICSSSQGKYIESDDDKVILCIYFPF
jgi:hypothetical protein